MIKYINPTTVNNYCIGIRAIGLEYKKTYMDLKEKYLVDREVYIDIVLSLISLLDEHIYVKDNNSLEIINTNNNLKKLCVELINLAKNDESISKEYISNYENLFNRSLYECIIELISYCVLENTQPLYTQNINIIFNEEELKEYMKIKLYEGVSYINSLIILSKKNNMYACAELGSLEFSGLIDGKKNYYKSYNYYKIAADKDHPKGCYMVAYLILNKKVKESFEVMWKYLLKSVDLGSAAGYNTLGRCYQLGVTPQKETNIEKAKYYYTLSSELGYTFAFNNLGYLQKDEEEAIKYYKTSADMGNSWACNKVGEYYRKKGKLDTAYFYYKKALEAPVYERNKWASINIKKYFKN